MAPFSLVMATGIVSVAALLEGFHALSAALGAVAAAAYGVLVVRNGLRLAGQGAKVCRELAGPPVAFDLLTFPAASAVVGVRLAMQGWEEAALALAAVALVSWALLAPVTALVAARRARDPTVREVSGNWLLIVVATQSLPVLATALPATRTAGPALLAGVGLWLTGLGLYAAVLARIVRRVATGGLAPPEFTADFWIVMGALAISTLAGTHLALAVAQAGRGGPPLPRQPLEPLLAGGAVATWALATAWIGPLAALQARRALHRPAAPARRVSRAPAGWRPEAGWWSAVFPLGMYSVASHELGVLLARPQLVLVGRDAFWVAFAAWLVAAALNTGGCSGRPCGRRR